MAGKLSIIAITGPRSVSGGQGRYTRSVSGHDGAARGKKEDAG
jgi:hypothetical protein